MNAIDIANQRLANGEISVEEYDQIISRLSPSSSHQTPPNPEQDLHSQTSFPQVQLTEADAYGTGNIKFSLPRNHKVPSVDISTIDQSGLWTEGEPPDRQLNGYEAWMGTDSNATSNPVGLLLPSRLGLLFVSDGKKRKMSGLSPSIVAGSLGANLLGPLVGSIAGVALGDEIKKGRDKKIRSARLAAIQNPNSIGIPYNEITEAWNTISRKGLKKRHTTVIKRDPPSSNPIYYYETCTDGGGYDTSVIRLAQARLYYETLTYFEALGIDKAWEAVQYFRSFGWLDKFLESVTALEELLHTPSVSWRTYT